MDFDAQAKLGLLVELDTSQVRKEMPELQRMLDSAAGRKAAERAGEVSGRTFAQARTRSAAQSMKQAVDAGIVAAQAKETERRAYQKGLAGRRRRRVEESKISKEEMDELRTLSVARDITVQKFKMGMADEATARRRLSQIRGREKALQDEYAADTLVKARSYNQQLRAIRSQKLAEEQKHRRDVERVQRDAIRTENEHTAQLLRAQRSRFTPSVGRVADTRMESYRTQFERRQAVTEQQLRSAGVAEVAIRTVLQRQEQNFAQHIARLTALDQRYAAMRDAALKENIEREKKAQAERKRLQDQTIRQAIEHAKRLRETQEKDVREKAGLGVERTLRDFSQAYREQMEAAGQAMREVGIPETEITAQLTRIELAYATHTEKMRRIHERLPWSKRGAEVLGWFQRRWAAVTNRIERTVPATRRMGDFIRGAAQRMRGFGEYARLGYAGVRRLAIVLRNVKNTSMHTYWTMLSIFYAIRNVMRPMRGLLRVAQDISRTFRGVGRDFAQGVTDAAGDVQTMRGRMSVLFGGRTGEAIRFAMDEAIGKPFEWTDIIRGMQRAMAMGLSDVGWHMMAPVTKTGMDLAAAFEKSTEDASMAIMQATYGSWQRMTRSFGFVASQALPYGYTQGDKTSEGIARNLDAVLKMLENRLGGTSTRMAYTWKVLVSNMRDIFKRFGLELEQAGVLDVLNAVLIYVRETFHVFRERGVIQTWARSLVSSFNRVREPLGWMVERLPRIVSAAVVLIEQGLERVFAFYQEIGGMSGIVDRVFNVVIKYAPLVIRVFASYISLIVNIGRGLSYAGEMLAEFLALIWRWDKSQQDVFRNTAKDLRNLRGDLLGAYRGLENVLGRVAGTAQGTREELERALDAVDAMSTTPTQAAAQRDAAQATARKQFAGRVLGPEAEKAMDAYESAPTATIGLMGAEQLGRWANMDRNTATVADEIRRVAKSNDEIADHAKALRGQSELDERRRRRGAAFADAAVEVPGVRTFWPGPVPEGVMDMERLWATWLKAGGTLPREVNEELTRRKEEREKARKAAREQADSTIDPVRAHTKKFRDMFRGREAEEAKEAKSTWDRVKEWSGNFWWGIITVGVAAIAALRWVYMNAIAPLGRTFQEIGRGAVRAGRWLRGRFGTRPVPPTGTGAPPPSPTTTSYPSTGTGVTPSPAGQGTGASPTRASWLSRGGKYIGRAIPWLGRGATGLKGFLPYLWAMIPGEIGGRLAGMAQSPLLKLLSAIGIGVGGGMGVGALIGAGAGGVGALPGALIGGIVGGLSATATMRRGRHATERGRVTRETAPQGGFWQVWGQVLKSMFSASWWKETWNRSRGRTEADKKTAANTKDISFTNRMAIDHIRAIHRSEQRGRAFAGLGLQQTRTGPAIGQRLTDYAASIDSRVAALHESFQAGAFTVNVGEVLRPPAWGEEVHRIQIVVNPSPLFDVELDERDADNAAANRRGLLFTL